MTISKIYRLKKKNSLLQLLKNEINIICFLEYLLKDQIYVAFTYMTGILQIAKQISQPSLNRFNKYLMLNDKIYY